VLGATAEELITRLAGDSMVPNPRFSTTRAITIEASTEEVWPWLVQMGHRRGGFYSYDRLLNLVGLHVRTADRIHAELQRLTVGDPVLMVPEGWCGLAAESHPTYVVASILTAHHVVLHRVVPMTERRPTAFESSWALVLVSLNTRRCRLVMRRRIGGKTRRGAVRVLFEAPIHALLERGMLRGIKARAESRARRGYGTVCPH
jgi:hypothetical protein